MGLLLLNTKTSTKSHTSKEKNSTTQVKKILHVDLDVALKEMKKRENRGKEPTFIDNIIFIDDEKEIIFNGNILEKNSPVTIKISHIIDDNGDNDEVSFTGKDYTISTLNLNDGDHVIMKNREGKIFSNQVIRREYVN